MFTPRAAPRPAPPDVSTYAPPVTAVDPAALARVTADLRRRLARPCAGLPAADFEALVDAMGRRALRWRAR